MKESLRINIAGAGIGGLSAAALLHDQGHMVRLWDQFAAPGPVGSGLVIQPVGLCVLDEIGIGAVARTRGAAITRMRGHEADHGRPVLDVRYDAGAPGRAGLGIHRAALFDLLWQACVDRGIPVETGAVATGHVGTRLTFADGRHSDAGDLIVDATGAGSPLSPLVSQPLPYGAIWGTVDWPETALPRDELRQCYRAADRMIGVLPLGRPDGGAERAALFWSLRNDRVAEWQTASLDAWREEATALWPEVAPFVAQITDHRQMTLALYSHGTLRRPWSEGLVHIGDAAHRASPQLGQGANMALLDAQALSLAIRLADGQNPLALYAAARRWHVRAYQLFSRVFTPQYQSDSRVLPWLRDRALFPLSQVPPLPRVLGALVSGTMLPQVGSLDRR
jgi:2-polyprenyl-6-methoxyphenol hydroxylase-like FAD-dependent oxidoreductase